nr:hypothetical protein [Mycoplasmopsis bovis]
MWWNQRRRKEEKPESTDQKPGGDKNPGGEIEHLVKVQIKQKS